MKKTILVMTLGFVVNAFGQGTVRFSNVSADLSSPPDRLVRFASGITNPYGTNNAPLVNYGTTSFRAQLYYGSSTATESSLVAVSTAPALFRASTTTAEPGTWAPGNRTLTGFNPGDTVQLQVRVWDFQFATSWDAAHAAGPSYGGLIGESFVFQYTIPTDPLAPLSAFTMTGFTTIPVGFIPEPSVLALAGLGVAALVIRRRK